MGMLERFPAYTYSTLMAEDGEFLRLLRIEQDTRREQEGR